MARAGRGEYLMDLETLLTIYVKDYKKYNYELLDENTIHLIR